MGLHKLFLIRLLYGSGFPASSYASSLEVSPPVAAATAAARVLPTPATPEEFRKQLASVNVLIEKEKQMKTMKTKLQQLLQHQQVARRSTVDVKQFVESECPVCLEDQISEDLIKQIDALKEGIANLRGDKVPVILPDETNKPFGPEFFAPVGLGPVEEAPATCDLNDEQLKELGDKYVELKVLVASADVQCMDCGHAFHGECCLNTNGKCALCRKEGPSRYQIAPAPKPGSPVEISNQLRSTRIAVNAPDVKRDAENEVEDYLEQSRRGKQGSVLSEPPSATAATRLGTLLRGCYATARGVARFVCGVAKGGAKVAGETLDLITFQDEKLEQLEKMWEVAADLGDLALMTGFLFITIKAFMSPYSSIAAIGAGVARASGAAGVIAGEATAAGAIATAGGIAIGGIKPFLGTVLMKSVGFCVGTAKITLVAAILSSVLSVGARNVRNLLGVRRIIDTVFDGMVDFYYRVRDGFVADMGWEVARYIPAVKKEAMRTYINHQAQLVEKVMNKKRNADTLTARINATQSRITAQKSEMEQLASELIRADPNLAEALRSGNEGAEQALLIKKQQLENRIPLLERLNNQSRK